MKNDSNLLEGWSKWKPTNAPYILDLDIEYFDGPKCKKARTEDYDWARYISTADFGKTGLSDLHFGLLPHPYCGDLSNAEIYILMLNPGLSPNDYYGEYNVKEYKQAVINNLKQKIDKEYPFMFLDPKFSWTAGYQWWHKKLNGDIGAVAEINKTSFAEATKLMAAKVASIELFPYHSASFHERDKWLSELPSVNMARKFVNETVLDKVRNKKAILIITRQVKTWGIAEGAGIVTYTTGEARGASLSPASDGGKAIIKRLTKPL